MGTPSQRRLEYEWKGRCFLGKLEPAPALEHRMGGDRKTPRMASGSPPPAPLTRSPSYLGGESEK